MTDALARLGARLDLIPALPGVYLMLDRAGVVIYVGKAINLQNRLRSYFGPNPVGNTKLHALLARIDDFKTILCANEQEALFLESTLIKRHQPTYNLMLRDDRDYPYIQVTMNELYPRVLKAFRIGPDREQGARYYGPYLAGDVHKVLETLRLLFPLKTCRRVLPRDIGKERPCLNYYIGRCIGPCRGDVPAEDYREVMRGICRFFEGDYRGLMSRLRQDMQAASQDLKFEAAGLLRDRIRALERLMENQKVVSTRGEDRDVIGFAANDSELCLQKLEIRQGRIIAAAGFFWPDAGLPRADVLRAFLMQHYPDAAQIPPEILLPELPADADALAHYLRKLRGSRVSLRCPARGLGRDLLKMADQNAAESLRRHTLLGGGRTALDDVLSRLAEFVGLERVPHRIEAIDISNLGAEDTAASMVVFRDGRPSRKDYRRFRIDASEHADDYEAMRQVLRRRLRHLGDASFGERPDLVLADGGAGHVAALREVLEENGEPVAVAGMVKDERHRTRGLVNSAGRVLELRQSFRSGPGYDPFAADDDLPRNRYDDALLLVDAGSTGAIGAEPDAVDDAPARLGMLRLLTAIQDEAHRFAGQYRNILHKKRQMRYALESISGIGPARRRLLLEHFGSIRAIASADLEQLGRVRGLGKQGAEAVYAYFHPSEPSGMPSGEQPGST